MSSDQLLHKRPKVKPEILLGPPLLRGPTPVHLCKDMGTGRSFEVGAKEHFLISRLDGGRTLGDVGEEYARVFGRGLGEGHWLQLLGLLHSRQLLAGVPGTTASPAGAPEARALTQTQRPAGILSGRVRLLRDATGAIDRLHAAAGFLLSAWFVVPAMLLVGVVEVVVAASIPEIATATGRAFHRPDSIMAMITVLWVSAAFHEIAHGLVARRFGGIVTEIGLRWRLPVVLLYCKVENYLYLRRRWHQVATGGAGAFLNLLLLLPFFLAWLVLPGQEAAWDLMSGILLLGSALAVVNLVPVPPTDGYQMLSHAVGMADYSASSRRFLWLLARRALGHGEGVGAYSRTARLAYAAYGAGSLVLVGSAGAGLTLASHVLLSEWFGLAAALVPAITLLAFVAAAAAGRRAQTARKADYRGRHFPPNRRSARPMRAATAGPAIVFEGVCKDYGDVRAVDGVNLRVARGEFLGLLGPNGAGKTTLVEIAMGLRRADAGSVSVLGAAPWPRNVAFLPRIGVQTQTSAFFVRQTAGEHLHTVGALYGVGRRAVRRTLRTVGLDRHEHVRVDDLSVGQRQRLAIASALVHDPELIFLDEPTAALDPQARRALWDVLRSLKGQGRTIVYITHHLDEAEALCDRVAVLVGGSVVALDTPQRLVAHGEGPTRLLVPQERISMEQARSIPGVDRVTAEQGSVLIETTAAGPVLAAVDAIAGREWVHTRSVTLEDVYLELTRREQPA